MTSPIDSKEVFRELADVMASSGSKNFYQKLVQKLEQLLQVDHVLLASVSSDGTEASTMAVTSHGRIINNFTFPLQGTPCFELRSDEPALCNGGVRQKYPHDEMLMALNAESFLGMAILDNEGNRLGVLSLLQNSEMTWPDLGREVLRIAVAQISAEMVRYRNEQRIQQLAYVDPLTKLPNRTAFHEFLNDTLFKARSKDEQVGLLVTDIRRFKEINDTHGHRAGDKLLSAVSMRLQSLMGEKVFLSRLASDEFAIVLTQSSIDEVEDAIKRVKTSFSDPFAVGARRFSVETNIGAALFPNDSFGASELLQHASIALDEAKLLSIEHCIYNVEMAEKIKRKQNLLNKLSEAIRTNKLELYFQPQFCLKTGKVKGAEALCRWFDDELGHVSPVEFIPLAEERGLIRELGAWVAREASEQMMRWQQEVGDISWMLSINLSAQQFNDYRIVEEMKDLTQCAGHGKIMLELTESVMMRDPEQAVQTSKKLHDAGLAMAIDDFGTGYSSLAYLQKLQLHEVKIDRSFVRDIDSNEQNHSIVVAIIAMAKGLGLWTVAEGVETNEEADTLKKLGCDYVQGYYFGKPVDADSFFKLWLKS
ncbi:MULTISPECIES: bifunctional diguanylate cyclase/phosphodiesterase [Gammaproteobacteria]|uniref:putative bifunctional diguanylate cyclase/phosphodiesterase n=1 Tax=Gammaproteobacteria TaxID=1236 RepID=UPI000DD00567|nr:MULTISPECIES: sensor domain-containing phosphodiesterase [Gammaproteobacteria]RTE87056.1 sensor domain-containing phosphodiesterase [Aliidiomarina sp. B3213]TCZ93154.1 sensor domain-containing phosphodiesterase [Lysobacter sp. N42]